MKYNAFDDPSFWFNLSDSILNARNKGSRSIPSIISGLNSAFAFKKELEANDAATRADRVLLREHVADRQNTLKKREEEARKFEAARKLIYETEALPEQYKEWLLADPMESYKLISSSLFKPENNDANGIEQKRLNLEILQQRLENLRAPKPQREVDPMVAEGRRLDNERKLLQLNALKNPEAVKDEYNPTTSRVDNGDGTYRTVVKSKSGVDRDLTYWERYTSKLGADPLDADYLDDLRNQRDELSRKNVLTPAAAAHYDQLILMAEPGTPVRVGSDGFAREISKIDNHLQSMQPSNAQQQSIQQPSQSMQQPPDLNSIPPIVDKSQAMEILNKPEVRQALMTPEGQAAIKAKFGDKAQQIFDLFAQQQQQQGVPNAQPQTSLPTPGVTPGSMPTASDTASVERLFANQRNAAASQAPTKRAPIIQLQDPTISKKSYKQESSNEGTRGVGEATADKLKKQKSIVVRWNQLYKMYKTRFNARGGLIDEIGMRIPLVKNVYPEMKGVYEEVTNADPQKSAWWKDFTEAVLVEKVPVMGQSLTGGEEDFMRLYNVDRRTPPSQVLSFLAKNLDFALHELDDMVSIPLGDPRVSRQALKNYTDLSGLKIDFSKIERDASLASTDAADLTRQQRLESFKPVGWGMAPLTSISANSGKSGKSKKPDKDEELRRFDELKNSFVPLILGR